jgi:hypothetical protein
MVDEAIAVDPCTVESNEVSVETADDGYEIDCILDGHGVRSGVALYLVGTRGDGRTSRHDDAPECS